MSAELLADMLDAAIGLASIDAGFDLVDWCDPDDDEDAARYLIEMFRAELSVERILLRPRERRVFDRAESALRARRIAPGALGRVVARVGLSWAGCRRIEAWLVAAADG